MTGNIILNKALIGKTATLYLEHTTNFLYTELDFIYDFDKVTTKITSVTAQGEGENAEMILYFDNYEDTISVGMDEDLDFINFD